MTDYAGHTAEALRALAAAATAGPWYELPRDFKKWVTAHGVTDSEWRLNHDADAAFVAAARLALPAALDRVAALEAENARLREAQAVLPGADFARLARAVALLGACEQVSTAVESHAGRSLLFWQVPVEGGGWVREAHISDGRHVRGLGLADALIALAQE